VAFDIVPAFVDPLSRSRSICELLGVDGEQWPRFFEWSEAVIQARASGGRRSGPAYKARCG